MVTAPYRFTRGARITGTTTGVIYTKPKARHRADNDTLNTEGAVRLFPLKAGQNNPGYRAM
jgi:hypothetical protein